MAAGFAVCLATLAIGQATISKWAAPADFIDKSFAEDLGYTFTGLTAALGFLLWKWGRAKEPEGQSAFRRWTIAILQAAAASLPALFGCIYFGAAGKEAERQARTFAALPPAMFLLAVVKKKKK
jgi:hypothetical protein